MIRSVWAITSGGEEVVSANKNKETNEFDSIFTRALLKTLDVENEESIFKKEGNVSSALSLTLQVMKNMKFTLNSKIHLPECKALAKSSTSSNLSQKGIPMFSSSPENLILKIKKGLYKENIELLSSNQIFKEMK